MFVSRLEIKKLYGFLNKEIEFNKDINLLVGINGSGKTSVLNVINWLLSPSWANLTTTEFESLKLEFEFENDDYRLFCEQLNDEVTIEITNLTQNYVYNKIQADINVPIKKLKNDQDFKREVISDYPRLKPEEDEIETWDFLKDKLPDPIIIGLDRNLYTEEGDEVTSYHEGPDNRYRRIRRRRVYTPMQKVKQLSNNEYTEYRNNVLELNKRLKDKIMLSSFDIDLSIKEKNNIEIEPKLKLDQVEDLEDQVMDYFREYIIGRRDESDTFYEKAQEKITNYFNNLKKVVEKSLYKEDRLLYITYVNQFNKTNQLIDEFEDFEKKNKEYHENIRVYLDTVNYFLKDSAKEIYFEKTSSDIKFKILDENGKPVDIDKDIDNLSSGEKQILILFTYIKFNDKLDKIFIIDEPELSLHPKWQESFLSGIKKIMPDKTQLLFATHSPTIVGENKEYCKTLLPY